MPTASSAARSRGPTSPWAAGTDSISRTCCWWPASARSGRSRRCRAARGGLSSIFVLLLFLEISCDARCVRGGDAGGVDGLLPPLGSSVRVQAARGGGPARAGILVAVRHGAFDSGPSRYTRVLQRDVRPRGPAREGYRWSAGQHGAPV